MNIFIKIGLIVTVLEAYAVANDCKFSLKSQVPHTPLILKNQRLPVIMHPNHYNSLELPAGGQLRLSCVDKKFSKFNVRELVATCVKGDVVRVRKQEIRLKELECTDFPRSTVIRLNGRCYGNSSLYEIGYPVRRLYLRVMVACFNESSSRSLYTYANASLLHAGHVSGVPRVQFEHDKMYKFNVSEKFRSQYQRQTLQKVLKSAKLARQYVKNDGQHFMARGHLSAKADFVYGSEQAATFHYANVAPQWQIFNGGNWQVVEQCMQSRIAKGENNLAVATGTYGVATLPDKDNVEQELYLHDVDNSNKTFPVPKFFWKIVYDKKRKVGDVVIGINNPYLKEVTKEYYLCKNVCTRMKWLKVKKNEISRGFIYCCDMDEFLKAIRLENMFDKQI